MLIPEQWRLPSRGSLKVVRMDEFKSPFGSANLGFITQNLASIDKLV